MPLRGHLNGFFILYGEAVVNKKFTEVAFFPIKPTEKGLIGFASGLFANSLSLNSIAVYTTSEGDFRLVFPNKVLPNSKKIHVVYPINKEIYEVIYKAVKDKIEKVRSNKDEGISDVVK